MGHNYDYYNGIDYHSLVATESKLNSIDLICSPGNRRIYKSICVHEARRKIATSVLFFLLFITCNSTGCLAQIIPKRYGNNPTKISWRQTKTPHFIIIYPQRYQHTIKQVATEAEHIFAEYQRRLGQAPKKKILLYYNGDQQIVSGKHALSINHKFSIWQGNPLNPKVEQSKTRYKQLRYEIGVAFYKHIHSVFVKYFHFLAYPPANPPWPDGLLSYLTEPEKTANDESFMRWYWMAKNHHYQIKPSLNEWTNSRLGRSQIQYFAHTVGADSLSSLYGTMQSVFGLADVFDFKPAFKQSIGQSYRQFERQWKKDQERRFQNKKKEAGLHSRQGRVLSSPDMRAFLGGAMNEQTNQVAFIGLPKGGALTQQLYVKRTGEKQQKQAQIVDHGQFQPVMDWSPHGDTLVYAKQIYNAKKGTFNYHLYSWRAGSNHPVLLTGRGNAQLPGFYADGTHLAYVVKHQAKTNILQMDLQSGSTHVLYSMHQPSDISHIDVSPNGKRILITYFAEKGRYRLGLLTVKTRKFTKLSARSAIPMEARWAADGSSVYFNDVAHSVANVFEAHLSGHSLRNIRPVSSQFTGATLWDVSATAAGRVHVLAKTGAAYATGKMRIFTPSRLPNGPNNPNESPLKSPTAAQVENTSNPAYHLSKLDKAKYHPFIHTQFKPPITLPYYASPGNFGFGTLLRFQEPMRIHAINITGIFSLADPLHKSFFFSEYVNNSLGPRIKLTYNRFTSGTLIIGRSRKVRTTNVLAASSLWKLHGISHGYSKWYVGTRLRYLSFDYLSDEKLRQHHSDIIFTNEKTRQTDLKAVLTWRKLRPNRSTFIDPSRGAGMQFAVTGSEDILGSQTSYARFNLSGYKIFPAFGSHHLYLYADGVIDAGTPAGRDYLGFDNNGSYELPKPKFLGGINPSLQRFVRGYNTNLLGDKLLFGRAEYRIPFHFNTHKKLLGFLPSARTVFTFFADGGILGHARISSNKTTRRARYSIGAEIKRVFSFSNFRFAYEVGIGKGLTKSIPPHPYVSIRMGVPF